MKPKTQRKPVQYKPRLNTPAPRVIKDARKQQQRDACRNTKTQDENTE